AIHAPHQNVPVATGVAGLAATDVGRAARVRGAGAGAAPSAAVVARPVAGRADAFGGAYRARSAGGVADHRAVWGGTGARGGLPVSRIGALLECRAVGAPGLGVIGIARGTLALARNLDAVR